MKGIIAVSGLPGSGKSYFAKNLADKINAIYLSSDVIRKKTIQNRSYSEAEKNLVYDEMIDQIKMVNADQWVVLDATFHRNENRLKVIEVAQSKGVKLFWLMITASEDTIRERLSKPRVESDADYEVYKKIKSVYEPFDRPVLVLKSDTQAVDSMVSEALTYIGNG